MAVRDGVILAVGKHKEVLGHLGNLKEVDLGGRTVLPSFTDAHLHFLHVGLGLQMLQLAGNSLQVTLEKVRQVAHKSPPGSWIQGRGFNFNDWAEGWPRKQWLDEIAPLSPVVLTAKDGHMIWVNSKALQVAGITENTPNPAGGVIERDESGQLTGILKEDAIMLVTDKVPLPTETQCAEALKKAIELAYSYGITAVHSMEDEISWRAWQKLRSEQPLLFRCLMSIPVHNLDKVINIGLQTGFGDEILRIGGVKLFVDGSLGSRTALMNEPYEGTVDELGVAILTANNLFSVVQKANGQGLPVVVHAIGDGANRLVLDAIEKVGDKRLRNRIEHAQLIHPSDLQRFRDCNVIASMQPTQCPQDRYMTEKHWGIRAAHCYPFRDLADLGVTLAFGSDCPVESMDVLLGLYSAVVRKRWDEPHSEPWHKRQAITMGEAIRAYTYGGAYAAGEEHYRGCLAPGMKADFVVLSHDILGEDPEILKETNIDATYFEGNMVYSA